jgi:hypothetical protein
VDAEGSTPIEFKIGASISGIEIVMEESETYVIEGKITTNDGKWPVHVSIDAYMGNQNTIAQIDKHGNYRLQFSKPGKVNIQAGVGSMSKADDVFGSKNYDDYCTEFMDVELTEENHSIKRDIVLEKAYYLYGRILDKEQNPIPNLYVEACSPPGIDPKKEEPDSYGIDSRTSSKGYFSIAGLRPNMKHSLVVKQGGFWSKNVLTRMDGLMPVEVDSDRLILIVLDKPEPVKAQ